MSPSQMLTMPLGNGMLAVMTIADVQAFWGKARGGEGRDATMHGVLAHSLDVAAVASLMPGAARLGLTRRTLGFLVALHDVGKFSRPFQAMAPDLWPARLLGPAPAGGMPAGARHDAMGLHLLSTHLARRLEQVLPPAGAADGWFPRERLAVLRALAGHHGRPPVMLDPVLGDDGLCAGCLAAAAHFVAAMEKVFDPGPLPCRADDRGAAALAWHLAGVVTLADWIGSRQAWFPWLGPDAAADPAAYFWDHALPRAASALAAAGLAGARPAPFQGLRRLFPTIDTPSPVQGWAATVALPAGPVLAVVEDLTGSGKTEAALTLAHRLIADGRADGVFLALPTMATANAMFARLGEAYRRLFAPEGTPSLALAHGRAGLQPGFRASIPADPGDAIAAADPADEPAESHCAAWLADDGRKALLAQVGVGTLDQALLAVLPVRHAPLRLQGLARKVLVVDEAHAYDPYMRRELVALLEFHAALGGSAVLLSATLPRAMRAELVDAYRRGLGAPRAALASQAYPLATLAAADAISETPCAPREGLPRRVAVTRLPDAAAALDRVIAAERAGRAVAWIRNTVDDAIDAAEALRARGIEPLVFHARFAMVDRLAREEEVLRRFGRDSAGEMRRGVVVATQVIEQSLDLDFDVLVTDLAPVDLLIQRAGRLWRHRREGREGTPELLVVSPEPVDDPPVDWIAGPQPGTQAVYRDPALLWRSARAVFRRSAIVTPDDMRPLIEEAFDEISPGAVPAALTRAAADASGKAQAATGLARQNLLRFDKPYVRDAGLWEPDTRTPTRLEDQPQVKLRLAKVRDGAVVPYAEDPDPVRAWALSEVRVAAHRVAACPVPPGLDAAATAARAGWGRWERDAPELLLAVLAGEAGHQVAAVTTGQGRAALLRYGAMQGLRFGEGAAANDPEGSAGTPV